jgi:hypothetical protein
VSLRTRDGGGFEARWRSHLNHRSRPMVEVWLRSNRLETPRPQAVGVYVGGTDSVSSPGIRIHSTG